MTRVDFYILSDNYRRPVEHVLCRLVNKAWQSGHQLYVHANDLHSADHYDKALWTFSDTSFLPHGCVGKVAQSETPVLIGNTEPPDDQHDVMINMTNETPLFFSRFERLIEIVDKDQRAPARQRYRFYQERGYILNTHNLDADHG